MRLRQSTPNLHLKAERRQLTAFQMLSSPYRGRYSFGHWEMSCNLLVLQRITATGSLVLLPARVKWVPRQQQLPAP